MSAPSRFQKLVQDAKARITEISVSDAAREIERGAMLIDVREAEGWQESHAPRAVHMPRGAIELDIEEKAPALDTPITCHCGGGSRSALAADGLHEREISRRWIQSVEARGLPVRSDSSGANS